MLPNIWTYEGDQKQIDKIVLRANEVVQVPQSGKLIQAARALDLDEDWKLVNYLEKTISLLGAVPAEVWDNLGSAGKVESGVALKLTWQPMADAISVMRKTMSMAEQEKMRVTAKMFNTYNEKKIEVKDLRPEITYKQDVIPVDEAVAILNDLALLADGVKSLEDLVIKYNPTIKTKLQAEEFIKKVQDSKPKPEPAPSLRMRDRAQANA